MPPEWAAHVWDAAEAARAVADFVAGNDRADYENNRMLRSAVERQLDILDRALKHLRRLNPAKAERVRDTHQIIGMRNVIAHEYSDIDNDIVFHAATASSPQSSGTLKRFSRSPTPDTRTRPVCP